MSAAAQTPASRRSSADLLRLWHVGRDRVRARLAVAKCLRIDYSVLQPNVDRSKYQRHEDYLNRLRIGHETSALPSSAQGPLKATSMKTSIKNVLTLNQGVERVVRQAEMLQQAGAVQTTVGSDSELDRLHITKQGDAELYTCGEHENSNALRPRAPSQESNHCTPCLDITHPFFVPPIYSKQNVRLRLLCRHSEPVRAR